MRLIVNGEDRSFPDNVTVIDVLETLQVKDKVMAVAVNMEVVKQENWDKFFPTNGDKIELLQFVGGG